MDFLSNIRLPEKIAATEFSSVVALLDDPDALVAMKIRDKLYSYGSTLIPTLRVLHSLHRDDRARANLNSVIQRFRADSLARLLRMIREAAHKRSDIDLEPAVLLVSQFGYPETNPAAIRQELDEIALRVHRVYIEGQMHNDLNLVLSINRVLFDEERYSGAEDDYYRPDNSYFIKVLQARQGIPISLSILYMLVAERVGVDIFGISMPTHFLVYNPDLNVYIDTFNKGIFLSHRDCCEYLANQGYHFNESMLRKSANIAIVLRLLTNIHYAHTKSEERWEADTIQHIINEIRETTDGL